MTNSLKDALLKAGLVTKEKIEKDKAREQQQKLKHKGPSQEGVHAHHMRTDCGLCKRGSPDVEYYEHTNRSILEKWLCIPCADKAWINDECRQTNQSVYARSGKFRREFGPTKKFPPAGGGGGGPQGQRPSSPKGGKPSGPQGHRPPGPPRKK